MTGHKRAGLTDRVRGVLADQPSIREVPMFGGRSFMVNDKMVAHVMKDGGLLVRVDPQRDGELARLAGASRAEMGAGRVMGPGWIAVSPGAASSDDQLFSWLNAALEYNQVTAGRK